MDSYTFFDEVRWTDDIFQRNIYIYIFCKIFFADRERERERRDSFDGSLSPREARRVFGQAREIIRARSKLLLTDGVGRSQSRGVNPSRTSSQGDFPAGGTISTGRHLDGFAKRNRQKNAGGKEGKLAMERTRAYRVCREEEKGRKDGRHRRVTVCTCSRADRTMGAVPVSTGLNIIINVAPGTSDLSLYVCVCVYVRAYMWKNRHLGDARYRAARLLSRLSDLLRAFSHGSPHGSLRGSNASRQSVFYCVYAQEASIINLTGGISRSTSLRL